MWICPYRYNHANPPIFIKCCESAHICKSALPLKIQKVLRKATNGTTHAIKSLRFHFNCQYGLMNFVWINSLWPGDAPQRQRCGSTLAQEMVWCLTSNVDISSTRFCGIHVRLISWKIKEFNLQHEFITASSSRGQWVNTLLWYTVRCCYSAVNFPQNIHERHPIAGPSGVSFVGSASDWYSASLPAMMCAISCYIRPRYTNTAKLTGPRTFTGKNWVGPVKLMCIIMFKINKIRPKSTFGPVKAPKFSRCLVITALHCIMQLCSQLPVE